MMTRHQNILTAWQTLQKILTAKMLGSCYTYYVDSITYLIFMPRLILSSLSKFSFYVQSKFHSILFIHETHALLKARKTVFGNFKKCCSHLDCRKYNFLVNWKLFEDTQSLMNAVCLC